MWWGCYTSIHDGTLFFSAHYENMGLGNSGESVILANLLILLILVIMGIIVILVHKFLYCGVRTKTSQELRTLSLAQAIHNNKVILINVVLNCQQCNQCLKCHM